MVLKSFFIACFFLQGDEVRFQPPLEYITPELYMKLNTRVSHFILSSSRRFKSSNCMLPGPEVLPSFIDFIGAITSSTRISGPSACSKATVLVYYCNDICVQSK